MIAHRPGAFILKGVQMSDSMEDTIRVNLMAMQCYKKPCDGVLWELPQWVEDERLREAFIKARNKILVAGYDAKDILKFMHEMVEMQRIALLECNRDITLQNPPAFHCETPVLIFGEVSKLAWFHEAVRRREKFGEEQALAYLSGAVIAKQIVTAKRQKNNLAKGHTNGGDATEANKIAHKKHITDNPEIAGILSGNVTWKDSELAMRIKLLGLHIHNGRTVGKRTLQTYAKQIKAEYDLEHPKSPI